MSPENWAGLALFTFASAVIIYWALKNKSQS